MCRKPEFHQRPLEEGDEDKSISSILGKIDSILLKSKEDVKEYEKRKTEFVSNDEEEFSYQCKLKEDVKEYEKRKTNFVSNDEEEEFSY